MRFVYEPNAYYGESVDDFYKKLINQIPDFIFKMIWRKEEDSYSVVFASESVNDIYELTVEEVMQDTDRVFRDRILEEDKAGVIRCLECAKINLTSCDHEFRVLLPEKGLRWMRLTVKPEQKENDLLFFYGRITDITNLKTQELKLQESEERYDYALNAASEGIWDWNIIENTVYFSGQAMRILGREEKDVVVPQSFWLERIHPDDIKLREAAKIKGFKNPKSTYESVYRVRTDDGKYRWLLSRGRAVEFDENGKPTRAIGIHKDITQFKEKEIELANTINIIGSQNNRLLNFAHIVSHNLRSHAGNLKMLLDLFKAADETERKEMLHHLEAISDGLTITIGHLKELVEIQFEIKTVKEKLNLRYYLKNILNILHNEISKHGVNIEINIPLDVTVNYNPAYLESILLNFTTNAIKYSSSERKPMISYDFEIIKGKKVLSISDNGLGIDLKRHKNAIFGMYKTFHKNQNSRGIGLFITKNQIEAMGGTVEVRSEVNKGTTFKIYFNEED